MGSPEDLCTRLIRPTAAPRSPPGDIGEAGGKDTGKRREPQQQVDIRRPLPTFGPHLPIGWNLLFGPSPPLKPGKPSGCLALSGRSLPLPPAAPLAPCTAPARWTARRRGTAVSGVGPAPSELAWSDGRGRGGGPRGEAVRRTKAVTSLAKEPAFAQSRGEITIILQASLSGNLIRKGTFHEKA